MFSPNASECMSWVESYSLSGTLKTKVWISLHSDVTLDPKSQIAVSCSLVRKIKLSNYKFLRFLGKPPS